MENMSPQINIVDAVLAGDKESFMAAFNAALATKVSDALEVKKVEVASTLIAPSETIHEEVERVDESGRFYENGGKAHNNGEPKSANPYENGSMASHLWKKGWEQARRNRVAKNLAQDTKNLRRKVGNLEPVDNPRIDNDELPISRRT